MLNLSIMNLDPNHIDEVCQDVITQQRDGVSTHALFFMKFNPEYTPPLNKAAEQCKIYDQYREKLDAAGAKHGVLVQATMGHVVQPREIPPFTPVRSFLTGEDIYTTNCPLDPDFRQYMKAQMKTLAASNPSVIMIDDDVGLVYRGRMKGCACPRHMAEFNRRAGTNMTREELYAHTQGKSEENKRYTDIFVQLQKDSIVGFVKAMREGIDEVNPSIQGVVSGIYPDTFCEFSGETSRIFAGANNPPTIRLNGGPYTKQSRFFTSYLYKAAALRENVKDTVKVFLAETDTCPHNRYSTSAALMHGHFTGSILEGATGAKHWITRLGQNVYEPASGMAYRKILAKYSGFYDKLSEYLKDFSPFGCRMPVSTQQDYGFVESEKGRFVSPWSTCTLERLGLPLYFGNKPGGAVFLDDISVNRFSDAEIEEFFKGTVVLSAVAAQKLNARGFGNMTGVEVSEWNGSKAICGELWQNQYIRSMWEAKQLKPICDGVEAVSHVIYSNPDTGNMDPLFPAVTRYENPAGGETIVFYGNPDTNFSYTYAFAMLNETRKKMLCELLSKRNHVPVYYPEDSEVYLRAGYLKNGEIMAVFFNLSYDQHEDIPIVTNQTVHKIEMLNPDGTRSACAFTQKDGMVRVNVAMHTLMPVVLFIT